MEPTIMQQVFMVFMLCFKYIIHQYNQKKKKKKREYKTFLHTNTK
jgi:preprotein translocase subunit YajC